MTLIDNLKVTSKLNNYTISNEKNIIKKRRKFDDLMGLKFEVCLCNIDYLICDIVSKSPWDFVFDMG